MYENVTGIDFLFS